MTIVSIGAAPDFAFIEDFEMFNSPTYPPLHLWAKRVTFSFFTRVILFSEINFPNPPVAPTLISLYPDSFFILSIIKSSLFIDKFSLN